MIVFAWEDLFPHGLIALFLEIPPLSFTLHTLSVTLRALTKMVEIIEQVGSERMARRAAAGFSGPGYYKVSACPLMGCTKPAERMSHS